MRTTRRDFCIHIGPSGIAVRWANGYTPEIGVKTSRATLRIINDRQVIDFYYRLPVSSTFAQRFTPAAGSAHGNLSTSPVSITRAGLERLVLPRRQVYPD